MSYANSTLLPSTNTDDPIAFTPATLPLGEEAIATGVSPLPPPRSTALPSPVVAATANAPTTIRLANGLAFTPVAKCWDQTPEERELVSASISQTWTDQAMRCYMTGAHCATCDIPQGNYSFACQMDKVVPVLMDGLGQPDPHRLKRIYPQGYPHTAY
jgi:hypothetical protein